MDYIKKNQNFANKNQYNYYNEKSIMKQKFILLSIALTIVLAISSYSNEKDSEISSTPHISIIEQSELSESSKNALKNGIEIGFASSDLWDR